MKLNVKTLTWGYRGILAIVWVSAGLWLWNTYYGANRSTTTYLSLDTGLIEITEDSEWMDILLNGEKIGYSFTSTQRTEDHDVALNSFMHLNTIIAGYPTTVTSQYRARVDSQYRLKKFDFFLNSQSFTTRLKGVRDGDRLRVRIIQGQDSSVISFPAPPDLTPSMALKSLIVRQGIAPGQNVSIPVYEPMSQSVVPVQIRHLGKTWIDWDSTRVEVNKLQIEYNGFPTIVYLDDNGLTYREESLMGLVMQRTEGKPDVSSLASNKIDLAGFYSVPLTGSLSLPVTELTVRINGLRPEFLPSSPLWKYRDSPNDSSVFTFRSGPEPAPYPGMKYLKGNAFIQSQRPEIKQLAKALIGDQSRPGYQARILVNYVYKELDKVPVANLTSALEILSQKKGDCSEHTTLFTSLSRSLDLPTRIRIGLVYVNQTFMYHAWPSVYLNGGWLDVDPTLGQYPADATHIPLLEGDLENLSSLIPILGHLSITLIHAENSNARP
ncbi:MAG: transglutaminase domain-containing protein [FCB group bacterium]|nr:transglutaminase domain-containing protein [FCB group bacterium]